MTTGRDVVYDALRRSGITGRGITPSATDTQDGLADLNDMIGQWRAQRYMVWDLLTLSKINDNRTTPYTMGPAGDFNMTPRPSRIESAFLRQLGSAGNLPVDTPLEVIESQEEYNRIAVKGLSTFPQAVFLQTAMPLSQLFVYPWPSPAGTYEMFISTKDTIPVVALITDMALFPEPYVPAMKFNLARRLRQAYGKGLKPDPELIKLANDSLDVIQQMNLQLPEMVMPVGLLNKGPGYNILSDQFGN